MAFSTTVIPIFLIHSGILPNFTESQLPAVAVVVVVVFRASRLMVKTSHAKFYPE